MKVKGVDIGKLAIAIFVAMILFFSYIAYTEANEVTLDPTQAGQTALTVTCDYPIEREDGTPLAINEIAKVAFHVEKNGAGGYVPAGENMSACRQVYDMSQVPDGVYVYVVTAIDTDGRESLFSTEMVTATVKRIANPNAVTGVSGSLS